MIYNCNNNIKQKQNEILEGHIIPAYFNSHLIKIVVKSTVDKKIKFGHIEIQKREIIVSGLYLSCSRV